MVVESLSRAVQARCLVGVHVRNVNPTQSQCGQLALNLLGLMRARTNVLPQCVVALGKQVGESPRPPVSLLPLSYPRRHAQIVQDARRRPDDPADLVNYVLAEVAELPREIILQLHVNPNVSLGSGYRAYPGYSVAQVRERFGIGW